MYRKKLPLKYEQSFTRASDLHFIYIKGIEKWDRREKEKDRRGTLSLRVNDIAFVGT